MTEEKQLTKKQRRDEIRKELEKAKGKSGRADLFVKALALVAVVLLIVGFVVLFVYSRNQNKASVKSLGEVTCSGDQCDRTHIASGTPHAAYNSNPPSNGPHYSDWQPCGVYDNEIVDERVIHSLEHGTVWITYKNKDDSTVKNEIKNLVQEMGKTKLMVSPRAKNDSMLALVSWGRVLKLDSFNKQKITDYIKLYRNGSAAPEPLAGC
ncbi:MAG: DUF3105 domain-containing protein [bacterium]|nr:DUF3105 domain-containing protein [bacterium]